MPIRLNIFFIVVIFFYGCSVDTPKNSTSELVKENVTLYTENLECLGKLIKKSDQAFNQFKAAVGNIQDKTGKSKGIVGKSLTQAAPDMALTALSRLNAIHLVATTDARDILQYDLEKRNLTPIQLELLKLGNPGSILKSNFFLTGSISEYNEDIGGQSGGLNIFRKYLDIGISGTEQIFSVAMDLRLVGSKSGNILKNEKNEQLVISLKNNIYTKNFNGALFRIFTASAKNGGGIDYGFKISDPKHLAIREIIEKAVFILIGKLYDVPFEQCEMPMPFEENIGGLIANNMTQKDQGYAQQVLELIPTNEIVEWKSSDIQYKMLSTKTYEKDDGTPCREYYITAIRHNRKEGSKGTACRHKNGVWKDI